MQKIFDSHLHLLTKHAISDGVPISELIEARKFMKFIDELLGGLLKSQASPPQVNKSAVKLGIITFITLEHAYANRMFQVLGVDLSVYLPINQELVAATRDGLTTYFSEFIKHMDYHKQSETELNTQYNIHYLYRKDYTGKSEDEIFELLQQSTQHLFATSIEGGHNLSDVPIRRSTKSTGAWKRLQWLQESASFDFISINLCHLSYIPEQPLGGTAQGVPIFGQLVFPSEDFKPRDVTGLTEEGKEVIRQAQVNFSKPVLIDLKHMSAFTRFDFYKYRQQLITEDQRVAALPIIASHTAFTFISLKEFKASGNYNKGQDGINGLFYIASKFRKISEAYDGINKLYANTWTLNLFEEDIVEIMKSRGLMGIIMDERVLGCDHRNIFKRQEREYISEGEWAHMLVEVQTDVVIEPIDDFEKEMSRNHIMLFCLNIVYAVKVGIEHATEIGFINGEDAWSCVCLGSDYDGLINPIDGFEDVCELHKLADALRENLPIADEILLVKNNIKALKYSDGIPDPDFLEEKIEMFLYTNGVRFLARFLNNWGLA
jgi:microsomal dipeptidase-like Zn-dependent dipeptidase